MVHSLVVLNASPPRSFYAAFYATLRDRLVTDPQLSLSDFQRLLWALSRVDYVPSQVRAPTTAPPGPALRLPAPPPRGRAGLGAASAPAAAQRALPFPHALDLSPPPPYSLQAWLKQFVEVSVVKLKFLRFRALSELIWALACWGYTPTAEWLTE